MDRISGLPDEILCHTLSFLSTKEAALTSLLSKRWRDLFALTPNLCFEDKAIDRGFVFWTRELDASRSFINFVDRVLTVSGNYPVKKFSLKCQYMVDSTRVNLWISNVMSRGGGGALDRLYLDVFAKGVTPLPLKVFTCKTLVELKLGKGFVISMVPKDVSLPALKTLCLDCIMFSNRGGGCEFEALRGACHVLEELVISGSRWEHWKWCCVVSCATLLRLTMNCLTYDDKYSHEGPFVSDFKSFSLDTPKLTYLHFNIFVPDEYPIVNLDSLVEAKLNLNWRWIGRSKKGNPTNFIQGLKNVNILNLTAITSWGFASFAEVIPVFENLSRLSVSTEYSWQVLPVLLKKTPNLESLIIQGFSLRGGKSNGISQYSHENSFLWTCPVKVVKITNFWGTSREFEQMNHFLEELPCLEMLKLRARAKDEEAKLKLTRDLQMHPKACKILLKFYPFETELNMIKHGSI